MSKKVCIYYFSYGIRLCFHLMSSDWLLSHSYYVYLHYFHSHNLNRYHSHKHLIGFKLSKQQWISIKSFRFHLSQSLIWLIFIQYDPTKNRTQNLKLYFNLEFMEFDIFISKLKSLNQSLTKTLLLKKKQLRPKRKLLTRQNLSTKCT